MARPKRLEAEVTPDEVMLQDVMTKRLRCFELLSAYARLNDRSKGMPAGGLGVRPAVGPTDET